MASHTSTTGPRPLDCEEWIAMLTDALDGALPASDAVAFYAHREECLACAQLLEEAQRGAEWLRFLAAEPEVPAGLADRILAHTTGPEAAMGGDGLPMLATAGPALPQEQAWFAGSGFGGTRFGGSLSLLYRHPAESRLLMTVAMAFFSIAFTLNLAGIRLKELHVRDLRPSVLATNVSRGYYSASAHVMRYYENLRFVYELESRVNELRRSSDETAPAAPPAGKQTSGSPVQPSGDAKPQAPGGGAAQELAPQARPSLPQHQGGSPTGFVHSGAFPARIIPVNLPSQAHSPAFSISRLSLPAGAHAVAPLTHTQDQAKRSLA